MKKLLIFLLAACWLQGCIITQDGTSLGWTKRAEQTEMHTGVVIGVYRLTEKDNTRRLLGQHGKIQREMLDVWKKRQLVRVLLDEHWHIPLVASSADHAELVALPSDWRVMSNELVNDGKTINIGDIVRTETVIGATLEQVTAIVRKCNASPAVDENVDWQIGCKFRKLRKNRSYIGLRYW